MTNRERLPDRRHCENFQIEVPNLKHQIVVTVGFYPDGRLAEVFVSDVKAGSTTDAVMRDAAVLLSIALQYQVPLNVIANAITRNLDGSPSSAVGVLIDVLAKETSHGR